MAIDFTIESPAPPDAVLASIRHHAALWRESKIPSMLRADRILTIEGYAEGARYRYGYMRRWYWRGERELHVSGEVHPGPHGGSVVTVRCGTFQRVTTAIVLSVAAIVACVAWREWQAWLIVGVILSAAYVNWKADADLLRAENPQADYLVSRIEAAVAAASADV